MIPIDDTPLCRDGKVLILAYDHGLEHGPVDFRDVSESADPARTFEAATHPAVTSVAVQKGVAEAFYPSFEDDVDLLLKLNGTSNLWMGEPDSAVNCSVEYADRLGAAAVGFTVYGGSNHEIEMVEEFRDAQEAARTHDLPVVMWSYPRGQGLKNDTKPSTISYAARLALELGADVAKVKHPGSRAAYAIVSGLVSFLTPWPRGYDHITTGRPCSRAASWTSRNSSNMRASWFDPGYSV